MAHRIVWSRRAVQDLDTLTAYIAADSPAYAGVVLKRNLHSVNIALHLVATKSGPDLDLE